MGSERIAIIVLVLGIFSFMIGGVWAGSRALLIEIIKSDNRMLISYYKTHYEILVQVLRLLMLVISGFWTYLVLMRKTIYPKWMVVFNPIIILGVIFLSYWVSPQVGKYIVPTAMNVTHFVLFTFSIIFTYKSIHHEERN